MAVVPIRSVQDVTVRKDVLKRGFFERNEAIRELEGFRGMKTAVIEDAVWKSVSKQNRKWTIIKSDVASIDRTTKSFLLGDGLSVTAEPKDTASARMGDAANIIERLGMGVWSWAERDLPVPLQTQIVGSAVDRGTICAQYGWVGWKDRGEVREAVEPQERFRVPGFEELNQPRQRITTEGGAPFFLKVLDPLDCYWQLGKHDRVLEVVHEFRAEYAQLVELYPDLAHHRNFQVYNTASAYNTTLTVVDYWNEQINAITIEGQEYKAATPHGYGKVPFIIELIAPELDRNPDNQLVSYWGTPFSLPVLEHVKALSWADSISATYMEEIAFALLQHKGIRTTGPRSPHIVINPDTKEAEYAAEFDFSPDARVKPMYDDEHLEYLQPPRLVDMLQEFKAARQRDIQLLTYAEGILTGVYNVNLSGHSVAQQKQAAMMRLEPYIAGINRAASRLMTAIFALFPQEWDRVGPFLIDLLIDGVEQQVAVTREMFDAIRKVTVSLKPKVPINPEAEMQFMLHAMQMDVFTLREVQEKSGVQDPQASMKQRAFEKLSLNDPDFLRALATERFRELGYSPPPPPQPPQALASGPPPGAPGPVGSAPVPAPAQPPMAGPAPMGGPVMGGAPAQLPEPYASLIAQAPPELQQQVMASFAQDPQGTIAMLDQLLQQTGAGGPQMQPGPPQEVMVA